MSESSTHSDAQVQKVYYTVLEQYGKHPSVNGVDIGYAAAEKVVRVHVTDAAEAEALPREIDGVKIVVVEAKYGAEA